MQGTAGGANQEIKLDGVRSTTSNAQKVFLFRIPDYLPADCVAELRGPGGQKASAVIAHCGPGGHRLSRRMAGVEGLCGERPRRFGGRYLVRHGGKQR